MRRRGDVPRVRPPRCAGRAHLAQAKRRRTLRGRPARGGTKAGVCDAGGAGGRPLQPEGRGHSVERQAELVCPRHPGPDGSPGSATFCLETDESCHDRSHVISRSHAIEARSGPRCHPQGREHGLSVLMPVVHCGCWHEGEAEGGAKPVRFCPCSSDVTCSAMAWASSTSMPRYLTVLSIFVCPTAAARLVSCRSTVDECRLGTSK